MKLSRALACALGSLILAACDIPTAAPILEQRWILPVENSSFGVAEFLPTGVTVNGSNFAVNIAATTVTQTLGQSCPSCAPLNGQTAPVPPFNTSFTTSSSLPANVSSATIASGSASIAVQNGFSFDPTANGGSVTITVTDGPGGRQLGQVVLGSNSLPANSTQTRTLTLAPGAVGASLTASTQVTSPGGQVATINTAQALRVTATPQNFLVSSARVNVANKTVNFANIELPDVPDFGDQVQAGAIILDITNPFGVSVATQLKLKVGTVTITKSFTISNAATSSVRVEFTKEELNQILDAENVTMAGTGTVSGGIITVTPTQQVTLKAKLDLTLRIGA